MDDLRSTLESKEMFDQHYLKGAAVMCGILDLPTISLTLVSELWKMVLMKVPRTPGRLIADCVYVVAFMTGNRRSVKSLADAAKKGVGYRVRVLPADRREKGKRWVETDLGQRAILTVIPDHEALSSLLNEYPSSSTEEE